jgi:hypothetical protein
MFGIILAHGALGAAWFKQEPFKTRSTVTTCNNTAAPLPYFQPPLEVLARVESTRREDNRLP